MSDPQRANDVARWMVIFDFSGTLSLEAILFAQVESLVAALKQSGLWQLGLDNPGMLWQEVISPTWNVSSTTARSYKGIMAEKIIEVLGVKEIELQQAISKGVRQFVDSYFAAARIAPQWEPLLVRLLSRNEATVVVATDHYLEATAHIMSQLQQLGIESRSALEMEDGGSDNRQIIVANSAELGARKANRGFWDRLQELLSPEKFSSVVLIDDFGANEPLARDDNFETRVKARMENTRSHILAVFGAQVELFPFFLENRPLDREGFQELIEQAGQFTATLIAEAQ